MPLPDFLSLENSNDEKKKRRKMETFNINKWKPFQRYHSI